MEIARNFVKAKFTSLYGLYVLMSRISVVNNGYTLLRVLQNVNYVHSGTNVIRVEIVPREKVLCGKTYLLKGVNCNAEFTRCNINATRGAIEGRRER